MSTAKGAGSANNASVSDLEQALTEARAREEAGAGQRRIDAAQRSVDQAKALLAEQEKELAKAKKENS